MIINSLTQHPIYYEKINLFEFLWTTLFFIFVFFTNQYRPQNFRRKLQLLISLLLWQKSQSYQFDVINIMNSIPNGNSARMLDLDYGYTGGLKEKELDVTLPYFGRMFNQVMTLLKQLPFYLQRFYPE